MLAAMAAYNWAFGRGIGSGQQSFTRAHVLLHCPGFSGEFSALQIDECQVPRCPKVSEVF